MHVLLYRKDVRVVTYVQKHMVPYVAGEGFSESEYTIPYHTYRM